MLCPTFPPPKVLREFPLIFPRGPNRILAIDFRIGLAVRAKVTITRDLQTAKRIHVAVARAGGPVGGLDLVAAAGADFDACAIGLAGRVSAAGGEGRDGGKNERQKNEEGLEKHDRLCESSIFKTKENGYDEVVYIGFYLFFHGILLKIESEEKKVENNASIYNNH